MLEDLPNELLEEIAEWLPPDALRSLSHASSRLYAVLTPRMYRLVAFCATSEWALNVLNIEDFFLRHSRNAGHLLHTRHLKIAAPIHLTRFNRCAAFNIFRAVGLAAAPFSAIGTADDTRAHQQFLEDLEGQLRRAVAHLSPGLLRSFTWRLGTCLPAGVMDREGDLIRHQKNLAHLSLTTDGSCPHAAGHLDGLCQLSSLESIEWEGIQHSSEIGLLQNCIRGNQQRLKTLAIRFSASAGRPDFFHEVLGLGVSSHAIPTHHVGPAPFTMPALSCLALSKARLPDSLQVSALSIFGGLKSLKLHDCSQSCEFLGALCRLQYQLPLQLFEFCCDNLAHDPDRTNLEPVVAFLLSFRGLRHLYLKLSNFAHSHQIEAVIRHHSDTLQTLVYHEKQLAPIDNERLWWDTRDFCPSWILDRVQSKYLNSLSAVALCANTSCVRASLVVKAKDSHLQVLHFRLTGADHLHRDIRSEIISHIHEQDGPDKECPCGCWSELARRPALIDCQFDWADVWEEESALSTETPQPQPCHGPDTPEAVSKGSAEIQEVLDFANWAFGPTGLPNLEVMAFGDFTHEGRHQKQSFVIRREYLKPPPRNDSGLTSGASRWDRWFICIGDVNNPSLWSNVDVDGNRFLSACPDGDLMESPDEW